MDLELDLKIKRRNITIISEKERNYQNAVTLKKLLEDAMETIEPAAKMHCPTLRRSPVTVPGVPAKFCIFSIFLYTDNLHSIFNHPIKTRKLTTGKCLTQSDCLNKKQKKDWNFIYPPQEIKRKLGKIIGKRKKEKAGPQRHKDYEHLGSW